MKTTIYCYRRYRNQCRKNIRPRRDSNPQSSDQKSDALSIRPRGHLLTMHKQQETCVTTTIYYYKRHKNQCRKNIRPRRDSNPQSSDQKSDALSIRPRGHLLTTHKQQETCVTTTIYYYRRHKNQCRKNIRLQRDSNPQSSDPKSDALSIRPRGHLLTVLKTA